MSITLNEGSLTIVKMLDGFNTKQMKKTEEFVKKIKNSVARNDVPRRQMEKAQFINHLRTVLSDECLNFFLEQTECSSIIEILHSEEHQNHQEFMGKLSVQMKEIGIRKKKEQKTVEQKTVDANERILLVQKKKEKVERSPRPIFFSFIDLCWVAVNFDHLGDGKDTIIENGIVLGKTAPRFIFWDHLIDFLTLGLRTEVPDELSAIFVGGY